MLAQSLCDPRLLQPFQPGAVEITTPTMRGAEAAMKYAELCAAPVHLGQKWAKKDTSASRARVQANDVAMQAILHTFHNQAEQLRDPQLSSKQIFELAGLPLTPKNRKVLKLMVSDGQLSMQGKGQGTLRAHPGISKEFYKTFYVAGTRYWLAKRP